MNLATAALALNDVLAGPLLVGYVIIALGLATMSGLLFLVGFLMVVGPITIGILFG